MFCIKCSNLLIDKSNTSIMKNISKRTGQTRFKYIVELCSKQSSKQCIYNNCCNAIQPTSYRKINGRKNKNFRQYCKN